LAARPTLDRGTVIAHPVLGGLSHDHPARRMMYGRAQIASEEAIGHERRRSTISDGR
jgi:hypothetical protein